jgi:hypothetical protein
MIKKCGRRQLIGDQHKTSQTKGLVFTLLAGLTYDLEPMAFGAGQN